MVQNRVAELSCLNGMLAKDSYRYGRAAITAGLSFWRQSLEIGSRHLGLGRDGQREGPSSRRAFGDGSGPRGWSSTSWQDLALDLSVNAIVALEQFGLELRAEPHQGPNAPANTSVNEVRQVHGRSVRLPIQVREASQGLVVYAASLEATRRALEADHVPFEPVELGGDRTAAGVLHFDYRDSDLDSYFELGAFCFVKPRDHPELPLGLYIRHLMVNQPFTQAAGREIWGMPKELEELDLEHRSDRMSCSLKRAGRELLRLSLPGPGESSSASFPFPIYSVLADRPQLSMLRLTHGAPRFSPGGRAVELSIAAPDAHPACGFLHSLALSEQPLFHFCSGQVSGTLGAPQPLA